MKKIALGVLLLLTACAPDTGADSPQAAVDAYIAALNAKDAEALQRLGGDGTTAEDAQRKLTDHGGQNIKVDNADISSDITPYFAVAKLSGTSSSGTYTERLNLSRDRDNRWHVAIAPPKPPDPNRPTSATDRPLISETGR